MSVRCGALSDLSDLLATAERSEDGSDSIGAPPPGNKALVPLMVILPIMFDPQTETTLCVCRSHRDLVYHRAPEISRNQRYDRFPSPSVLESALSVHECAVRRNVRPVRQVGPVRLNWCAALGNKAPALDKPVFAIRFGPQCSALFSLLYQRLGGLGAGL